MEKEEHQKEKFQIFIIVIILTDHKLVEINVVSRVRKQVLSDIRERTLSISSLTGLHQQVNKLHHRYSSASFWPLDLPLEMFFIERTYFK